MDEAHDVIRRLHRSKDDVDDTTANKEFFQMKKQLELDRQLKGETGAFEIFATASNRRRAYVGFTLMFGNEFTGVLIIANYGVLLYESLGLGTYMPLLLSALWVTLSFPGNVFTALFIDRFGRRRFMLIGISGILITLILEAVMQARYLGTSNTAGQKAAVFFIFLFIFFWSSFIDASQYLYLAEIFPTHIRSSGMVRLYYLCSPDILLTNLILGGWHGGFVHRCHHPTSRWTYRTGCDQVEVLSGTNHSDGAASGQHILLFSGNKTKKLGRYQCRVW